VRATMLAALGLVAALVACADPDPVPAVTITAAAPDTLVPADDYRNDLTISVDYADGDGDLGRGRALVHDCRADGLITELALPAIASDEAVAAGVAISGALDLRVNDVGAVAPAAAAPAACAELGVGAPAAGTAIFCVVLIDAAGHAGAGDCTAPLTVR